MSLTRPAAVDTANATLSRAEQIKRFAIVPAHWEPGGDEITPTMKLKRHAITAKYADVIESLYATAPPPEQPGQLAYSKPADRRCTSSARPPAAGQNR